MSYILLAKDKKSNIVQGNKGKWEHGNKHLMSELCEFLLEKLVVQIKTGHKEGIEGPGI